MSNQGQGLLSHFIKDFNGVRLYEAQVSGEDHWSSGLYKLELF